LGSGLDRHVPNACHSKWMGNKITAFKADRRKLAISKAMHARYILLRPRVRRADPCAYSLVEWQLAIAALLTALSVLSVDTLRSEPFPTRFFEARHERRIGLCPAPHRVAPTLDMGGHPVRRQKRAISMMSRIASNAASLKVALSGQDCGHRQTCCGSARSSLLMPSPSFFECCHWGLAGR
jgi:hypothetical protein